MYARTYVRMCIRTCARTFVCTYVRNYVRTYVHTYVRTCHALQVPVAELKAKTKNLAAPRIAEAWDELQTKIASLVWDKICRFGLGQHLQTSFRVAFASFFFPHVLLVLSSDTISGFVFGEIVAGLILDAICTPGGGQDLQTEFEMGHGRLA